MRLIDEQFLETLFYGSRQMKRWLRRQGYTVSRKRVRRLMRLLRLQAIFQRPWTSQPHPEHRIYPYLLGDLQITRPNHVWCADVTYIPLQRGFLYLVAVMDWARRKVLSWRLSNTLDASFCVEALQEALERYGAPEIFNTDQGSQFTSVDFTDALKEAGIRISMDGKGRWMDNVFIERLWRSLKYEQVYLSEYATGSEARAGIGCWMDFYNERRPPQRTRNAQYWDQEDARTWATATLGNPDLSYLYQLYRGKVLLDVVFNVPINDELTFSTGAQNILNTYPDVNLLGAAGQGIRCGQSSPFGFNGAYYYVRISYDWGFRLDG